MSFKKYAFSFTPGTSNAARTISAPQHAHTKHAGARTLVVRADGDDEAVVAEGERGGAGVARADALAARLRRGVGHRGRHGVRRGGGGRGGGRVEGERRGRGHLRVRGSVVGEERARGEGGDARIG